MRWGEEYPPKASFRSSMQFTWSVVSQCILNRVFLGLTLSVASRGRRRGSKRFPLGHSESSSQSGHNDALYEQNRLVGSLVFRLRIVQALSNMVCHGVQVRKSMITRMHCFQGRKEEE